MKIGLYFGSFNPIHVGHLIIASFIANSKEVEQVWFVVSPHNPFKKTSSLLNEYDRLHLVNLSIKDDPQLKCSDVEFKLPKPSYTINTLTYLFDKYPEHSFLIIVGSDSFNNIKNWKQGDVLLAKNKFLVYKRSGFNVKDDTKNAIILNGPLLEISSTYIREEIRNKRSIRYFVTESVREEIEKYGYYKNKVY